MAIDFGRMSKNQSAEAVSSAQLGQVKADARVVIVSAYGRGHCMALELKAKGWRVTLIDVTSSLGPVEPEDAEGPFGVFESTDLSDLQKKWLEEEGGLIPVSQGFTLWLPNGPIEMRSVLTEMRIKSLALSQAALAYVARTEPPGSESERDLRQLARAPFRESWIAHLAHQLFANRFEENHRALEIGNAAPIMAKFSLHRATRETWKKGLAILNEAGVTVREDVAVSGIRVNGNVVEGIDIGLSYTGTERAGAFVWLLSSSESKSLPSSLTQTIFPEGPVEADWCWYRFRINFEGNRPIDALPAHVVMIDDLYLPWTHGNALVMRRREGSRSADVWTKVPVEICRDIVRLQELSKEIIARLIKRMPAYEPAMDLGSSMASLSLQKSMISQPVYSTEKLENLEVSRFANFFFSGPECNESLEWVGVFRAQKVIASKLDKLKSKWDVQARREAAKANSKRLSNDDSKDSTV